MPRALSWILATLAIAALGGCDTAAPELVINEFMADNASVLQAEDGSFPDWIELYNAGDSDASLDGVFITDNLAAPTAWALPADEVIEPGGFLLLLADGEEAPGHVLFKLERDGEEIGLYKLLDGDVIPLDEIVYQAQPEDFSSARVPDGGEEWELTDAPTPGESNG